MRAKKEKTRIKSRYDELPPEMQQLIDTKLADPNNSYTSIAEDIKKHGFEISRSSIGRLALRRNEENKAVTMRLKMAKEQARVAIEMSKSDDVIGYMKGIINIAMNDFTNRILTASPEDYDEIKISQVYIMFSRLVRDMTNIARYEYTKDKGFSNANEVFRELAEKYFGDNPEIRDIMIAKIEEEARKQIQ